MNYKRYLIKKGKLDLLSSLKALDKRLLNEKIEEYGVNNINELKDYILDFFRQCLEESKDDFYTKIYFEKLLDNENREYLSSCEQDLESHFIFLYNNGSYDSYYIPIEIKEIIKDVLGELNLDEIFNLENASNTPIVKDLKGLLEALVVDDLKHIGNLFNISNLSHKKKKELVKIIYDALTDKDKLTSIIERFIDKEFELLQNLMANKGTIQDNNISAKVYHFLYMTGLIFIFRRDDKFYISMTDDVYNTIKKIDLNSLKNIIDENTKAYNMVRSMVELYGVVSNSYLDYYYSIYYGNGEYLDIPNNALLFCDRMDNIDTIYINNNLYFIHILLRHRDLEEVLNDIIARQESIKRKPIKLKELLKYSNYDYYEETESKNKFKKYLKDNNIPLDTIEEIIMIISNMYRLGSKFIGVSIEMLQDYGVEITEGNMQEILNYLMDIYNNSRVWINNGWTPIEMRKDYK